MKLNKSVKDLFSPREQKVISSVGTSPVALKAIAAKVLAHEKKSLDADNGIAQAVRRINRKCDYYKLSWFLNGVGGGRKGKIIWVDKNL